jgi:hypothetical protein
MNIKRAISIAAFILTIHIFLISVTLIPWTIYERVYVKHTEQNADQLIEVLSNYQNEVGFYPMDLESLSPDYIRSIPPIKSVRGVQWLYKAEGDYFLLGYTRYSDKLGYMDCVYNSINIDWECGINRWETSSN